VTEIDDWSSSEDALIRNSLKGGADFESIADTLLRSTQEVIERAAELQRRMNRSAQLDALLDAMPDEEPVEDEQDDQTEEDDSDPDDRDDVPQVTHHAPPEPQPTPAPAPAPLYETATPSQPAHGPGKCRVCGKPIGMDDKITRLYCSTGCAAEGKRLDNLDRYRKMKARVVIPADIAAPNPFACRINKGAYRCCLRPRHSGDHLTDHGIIFSRDGKDVWRDVDDAYLMMCLNNDMVAPQA
jgi:predicted nucleic acid-binding Zn ribbon protein